MSADHFQIVLWGATALVVVGLCVIWWRRDVRERRDAELTRRWTKATLWSADASARVVRVARIDPGVVWLDDGDVQIEVQMPDGMAPLDVGWFVHVTQWTAARRAARGGEAVRLGSENVRDAFPPGTPALADRLMGRGERRPGFVSRLLGLRGP